MPDPADDCARGLHEKVFSPSVLLSYPAQYPWICRLCGAQGVERDSVIVVNEYADLMKKFHSGMEQR
jgi:hypothetical protein